MSQYFYTWGNFRACDFAEFIQELIEYTYEFGAAERTDDVGKLKQIPLNSYTSRIIIWHENYIIKRMLLKITGNII